VLDEAVEFDTRSTLVYTFIFYISVRCCEGGALLGDHCDGPRLCDHTSLRNVTRVTRPCLITESYVTRTSQLLVQHQSDDGTALHPAHFRARYVTRVT
jgi:hypothetical protein